MVKRRRHTSQRAKLMRDFESASSQPGLDVRPDQPIRVPFERIFEKAKTAVEKGRWFEHLFMAVARDVPDFQVANIWPWREWPERSRLAGLDGRDIGIDLVAKLKGGDLVAIQCKCYDHDHRVAKADVDSFISASDIRLREGGVFDLRWVVSTCPWNSNAENAIRNKNPEVRRIDFLDFLDRTIRELGKPDVRREPKPLQEQAIDAVVDGLVDQGNARGKLVMACGTGKTFTSLRAAERLVPDDGRIVFAAPTISLVSQARREWLTHTVRPLSALVVCSDRTAGGKGERHEAGPDDLVCPVLSDPAEVASHLSGDAGVKTVFCTYHSLDVVLKAQADHAAPPFDLAIADEAHRTTGVDDADRKVNFQHFHHRMDAAMRIYMTATERIYKETSKANAKNKGLNVVDMSDIDTYGPLLHKLKFKDAVAAGELSDYRVIVLGVHESHLTPGIRASLEHADPKAKIDEADLTRLYAQGADHPPATRPGAGSERDGRALGRRQQRARTLRETPLAQRRDARQRVAHDFQRQAVHGRRGRSRSGRGLLPRPAQEPSGHRAVGRTGHAQGRGQEVRLHRRSGAAGRGRGRRRQALEAGRRLPGGGTGSPRPSVA